MPLFDYVAVNATGRNVKGSVDADSPRAARQKLRLQGLFPTDVTESSSQTGTTSRDVSKLFKSDRVSLRELSVSTRQLATLVAAGLPLVSALAALTDQTEGSALKRIIVTVKEHVEEGDSLATALGRFPKAFPGLYINMVGAGEASGTLDKVLENLAEYLEAQIELRRKVTSALVYPIVMLFICAAVITGLLVGVVPKIVAIFQKQGAELPLPTKITIAVSNFVINYWYLIIPALALLPVALSFYYRQPRGRAQLDRLLFKLPIFGQLYIKICTARIARTLGTLLESGVGLLEGLEITRNIVENVHLTKALADAKEGVREGRSLARELAKPNLFPPMLGHMVAVGEKSGELESMLIKAGKAYESEVSATVGALTSLLEPFMMIVVGSVVLMIVVSILLPMADLISIMQKTR